MVFSNLVVSFFSGMEEDAFRISNCNLSNCWIQSKEQKFLILRDSGSLDVQDLNLEERQQSGLSSS